MSPFFNGGDERVRTAGLLLARQALSQLSYTPAFRFGVLVVFVSHSIHFSRSLYLENRTVLNERTLRNLRLPLEPREKALRALGLSTLRFYTLERR